MQNGQRGALAPLRFGQRLDGIEARPREVFSQHRELWLIEPAVEPLGLLHSPLQPSVEPLGGLRVDPFAAELRVLLVELGFQMAVLPG